MSASSPTAFLTKTGQSVLRLPDRLAAARTAKGGWEADWPLSSFGSGKRTLIQLGPL